MLAGRNIGSRFVVPTVASSLDLVVHLGVDPLGVRRINEFVAVPGRVDTDLIETETRLRAARVAHLAARGAASRGWRSTPLPGRRAHDRWAL